MGALVPARSQLVLIGTSSYENLPDLPTVRANVASLSEVMQAPDLWGIPEQNITTVYDPRSAEEVISAIQSAADKAADALVFYYAGHGITDHLSGELYLALTGTTAGAGYSAIRYEDIRLRIHASNASYRIVILDCCYSGRAIAGMSGSEHVLADEAIVEGSYVLTSAAATQKALAPVGEVHTAFTGELLDLLTSGVPDGPEMLNLDTIYREVRIALKAKSRPEPHCRDRNLAGRLSFIRNRGYRSESAAYEKQANAEIEGRLEELDSIYSDETILRNVQIPLFTIKYAVFEGLLDRSLTSRGFWRQTAHGRRMQDALERLIHRCGDVDKFIESLRNDDPQAIEYYFSLILDSSPYPEWLVMQSAVAYEAHTKTLIVDCELPGRDVIPHTSKHLYSETKDVFYKVARLPSELNRRYRNLIESIALRTLHEVFAIEPGHRISSVMFTGRLSSMNSTTGVDIRPALVHVQIDRANFMRSGASTDKNFVHTVSAWGGSVSPDAWNMVAVPTASNLDPKERPEVRGTSKYIRLLDLAPVEFEHLIRELLQSTGLRLMATSASADDGADAVFMDGNPISGGMVVMQAKRYSSAVSVEVVRALAGVVEDKRASRGVLVTTSWFGAASREFAARHGRLELIDGKRLAALLKEHLNIDVNIPPHR